MNKNKKGTQEHVCTSAYIQKHTNRKHLGRFSRHGEWTNDRTSEKGVELIAHGTWWWRLHMHIDQSLVLFIEITVVIMNAFVVIIIE